MRHPTEQEIRRRHAERLERLARRESEAWREYVDCLRGVDPLGYEMAEPMAWRRLRRRLAELAFDRRREEFELDRALVADSGLRKAS